MKAKDKRRFQAANWGGSEMALPFFIINSVEFMEICNVSNNASKFSFPDQF